MVEVDFVGFFVAIIEVEFESVEGYFGGVD